MKGKLFQLVILFATLSQLAAQTDSVKVLEDREDGIYLSYDNFRRNVFISKDQIVSDFKKDHLDFMSKVLATGKFEFKVDGSIVTSKTEDVWGVYQNKILYVNFDGEFCRTPVFGSISYMVTAVTKINPAILLAADSGPNNLGAFWAPTNISATQQKIKEYIFNFYDGVVSDFTIRRAEALLRKDLVLFAEYKNLSRKNRKRQIKRFSRRFNELHPVYFLK
jgi:hypothetical protein